MVTALVMWEKLLNVLDSVTTPEQCKTAVNYANIWRNRMNDRMTVTDVEYWNALVEDMHERFQPA